MGNFSSKQWTVGQAIGYGGFGEVRELLAQDEPAGVCLKIPHPTMNSQSLFEEYNNVRLLEHPNILTPELTEWNGRPALLMEQATCSLQKLLDGHAKLNAELFYEVCLGLLDAVAYAHEHHVMHRDIKPDNILMFGETIKLSDFGLAKIMVASKTQSPVGTPGFVAPEISAGLQYDYSADIYSCGRTMHALLERCALPYEIDAKASSLIDTMMDVSPALRPTARELLVRFTELFQTPRQLTISNNTLMALDVERDELVTHLIENQRKRTEAEAQQLDALQNLRE